MPEATATLAYTRYVLERGLAGTLLLGTGGALRLAVGLAGGETLLAMNGDSYFGADLGAFFRRHREHPGALASLLGSRPVPGSPLPDRAVLHQLQFRRTIDGHLEALELHDFRAPGVECQDPGGSTAIGGNVEILDLQSPQRVRIARADATEADVDDALRAVGAYDRFAALPDGLETEVRERGSQLSAGEKQLVSLARTALADPAVLVLDEATSSLDPGTEALVERALDRIMEGRTVIVIAHRLSTAARADMVGVVADGRLAELGHHDDLIEAGGHYAALYRTWVSSGASDPEVDASVGD